MARLFFRTLPLRSATKKKDMVSNLRNCVLEKITKEVNSTKGDTRRKFLHGCLVVFLLLILHKRGHFNMVSVLYNDTAAP